MKRDARQNRKAGTLPRTNGAKKGGNRITEETDASAAVEKGPLKFGGLTAARDTGLKQRGRVRKKYPAPFSVPRHCYLASLLEPAIGRTRKEHGEHEGGKK